MARRDRRTRSEGRAQRTAVSGDELQAIWETEPGIAGWLSTVDHKEIGIRYIVTAFVFLVLGGIEALVMRAPARAAGSAAADARAVQPAVHDARR